MEKQWMGLNALRPGERGILREILMLGEAQGAYEELGRAKPNAACIARRICRLRHMRLGGAVFALRKMRRRSLWRRSDEPETDPCSAPLRWPETRTSAKAAFSTR